MALVDPSLCPEASWEFSAEILVLHHSTTLSTGYAPVMHIGVCSQSAQVTSIVSMADGKDLPALRTGDRALVTARFMYRPEYIHVGEMLLFREGRAKGVGRIKATGCPHKSADEHHHHHDR
jgi:GTPase